MASDIESALYSHLTGTTDLVAQVGTRIYPNAAPPREKRTRGPFIVYRRISTTNEHTLAGALGVARPTFEFAVIGDYTIDGSGQEQTTPYSTIKNISDLLRTHLDGYQGVLQSAGVRSITHISTNDDYIAPTDAGDVRVHIAESDYQVWHTETVPTFTT